MSDNPTLTPEDSSDSTPPPAPAASAPAPVTPEPTVAPPVPSIDPTDSVAAKLAELGVTDASVIDAVKRLGAETVDDLANLKEGDLVDIGVPVLKARKLIGAMAPTPTIADTATMGAMAFEGILPEVPDDGAWLDALRTGGVLKVGTSSVISAIRAALASRVGLYEVPDRLATLMEEQADSLEEQVDPEFFNIVQQVTQRNYADIFAGVPGLTGKFVTVARKNQLFARMDDRLWPAIMGFDAQLKAYMEAWTQGAANPMMIMAQMFAGGAGGGVMPPSLMAPPPTDGLRDQASAVNDAINSVFAGMGVQIAAALAYDATRVRKTLEIERLPVLIGAANKEQMLKKLGIAVDATYPRLERFLTSFVLGTIKLDEQPAGQPEQQYINALYMLGMQIPWDQLGSSSGGRRKVTGIAGDRKI